jgi:mRNA-degrading endonuclease YafQ of YafQ-DinJ toxin-antitoxin module
MSYNLIFTDSYKKHPELAQQYRKVLYLLKENPQHPSLRLHLLKGRLQDVHSVSINLSYRITLELLITEKEIILINIGSHDDVY